MTCKHRYEPSNFAIRHRPKNSYWWECVRCGHAIFSELKEKNT